MISYPQQRASPILEKAREGSHRRPADEGWAKGGGGPRSWSPCGHPPPAGSVQKWEAEARWKHALGSRERLGMIQRGSLSTVPSDGSSAWSSPLITELERGGVRQWPLRGTGQHLGCRSSSASPAGAARSLPPSLSVWRKKAFSAPCLAITWLCSDSPGEKRRISKTNQIQSLK